MALHPTDQVTPYPPEVHHRIRRDERGDYHRTGGALADCVDAVSVQHAADIWGGVDGEYVLEFVQALTVPAVVTLHTVLPRPTPRQRSILAELIESVAATVVMSRTTAALLTRAYDVDPVRVDVVPYGVPDLPLMDPATIKPGLGLAGREVILSFGLLSPGKGYELAIDSLPAVIAAHPSVCYVIAGVTHSDLLHRDGETYRSSLVDRVQRLGVGDHVRFVDKFLGRVELTRWLEAADIIVTPYPDLDLTVSGVLAYAMGAGRAIVSTPFAYAAELLAEGRGVLVAPGDPATFAAALLGVLGDPERRASLGRRAHEYSRGMVWSRVGADYSSVFDRVSSEKRVPRPRASLAALNA